MDAFATLIVPAAHVELARRIAAALSPGGVGMWTAGLSPTGNEPATHYVSTGHMRAELVAATQSAEMLFAACQSVGDPATLADCTALVTASDVSPEPPFDAFARLGLQLIAE